MTDRMTPSAKQETAIQEMVDNPTTGALVAAETGTGKTLIAVEVAMRRGAESIVVSAPIHTHDGWEKTIRLQYPEVGVFRINSTLKAGKEARARLDWGMPGFYLISRELWRGQDWENTPEVDVLIHDECHTLAGRDNVGSKLARRIRKGWMRTKHTICMSATPFGNSFKGAWSIGRIIWPDLIDRVPIRWDDEWCASVLDVYALNAKKAAEKAGDPRAEHMSVTKVIGEKEPGRFVAELPCYIFLENDAAEKPVEDTFRVTLSRAQRKLYDEFEEKGVTWLNDHPMVADVPIVQRIRLRQLTLGECILIDTGELDADGDPKLTVDFADDCKSTKLDTLQEILADEFLGQKVFIATDSKKFAKVVAKRIGGFAWTGDATQKARDTAKEQFIDGDLQYIVATQQAISEGTDGLQYASHCMVVISENDSNMLNTQMLGRLARRGQTKRVVAYHIIAEKTYDDRQANTLLTRAIAMRKSTYKEAA